MFNCFPPNYYYYYNHENIYSIYIYIYIYIYILREIIQNASHLGPIKSSLFNLIYLLLLLLLVVVVVVVVVLIILLGYCVLLGGDLGDESVYYVPIYRSKVQTQLGRLEFFFIQSRGHCIHVMVVDLM